MEHPIVRVSEGHVRGRYREDINGSNFVSFEGIPYGEPPVGNLRFKSPVPVSSWNGVKDALAQDLGCLCKQEIVKQEKTGFSRTWKIEGSEDCLNLNVYTRELPNADNPILKPVMVFIHGGAFTMGSTRLYGPEALITEDIVLVTIHYRLGALGFLVLDDPKLEVPGNAALKDQVLALKWIQRNISYFNGNKDNVTIFGHSAGAASVTFLILSPLATGLFHKAIIQSGSGLSSWGKGDPQNAKHLAAVLGCTSEDERVVLQFLQEQSAEKIYEGQFQLTDKCEPSSGRNFAVVVERKDSKDGFLMDDPMEVLKSGKYNHVPIILGYTNMECLYLTIKEEENPFNLECFEEESLPPLCLGLEKSSQEFTKVAKKIRKFYYGESEPELLSLSSIQLATDSVLIRGLLKQTEHFSKTSKQPIYLYRMSTPMDHGEPFSSMNLTGVPHGGELPYLFKMNIEPKLLSGDKFIVRNRFIKLWTNFSKYGNPTPKDSLLNINWKPVEKGEMHFLDIGDELVAGIDPESQRMAFWDELFRGYPQAVDY